MSVTVKADLTFLDRLAIFSATGFGIGYMPKAPGTWGSLLGLGLGVMLNHQYVGRLSATLPIPTLYIQVFALIILSFFGFWCIHRTEQLWGEHDSGKIVWDEIVGQAIPLAFITITPFRFIAAFALFRFFDIWKPGLIGWADEKLPGAWGTLVDDILAGIAAAICLLLLEVWVP